MFDLYANIRPAKTTPGINTRFENVNLVLFRENTEGFIPGWRCLMSACRYADSIARVTSTAARKLCAPLLNMPTSTTAKK